MTDMMYVYIFLIMRALLPGLFVALGFRTSWRAEHGEMRSWRTAERGDTVVWLDPIVLPIMFVIFSCSYYCFYGPYEGTQYIFYLVIDIFIFISIYFTLLLLFLPVLRKYYTARTCATLWLIPVFLFYTGRIQNDIAISPKAVLYIPEMIVRVLLGVWTAGFIIIFLMQIISHIWYVRDLKNHSYPVEDGKLTEKWDYLKNEMDLFFPIGLRYCSVINTPLTVGMRKKHRITYLPAQTYSDEDAELIFSHELHHIQRNDAHTKFFLRFCNALGWIHPFVWIAIRKAEDDLELSCDEIVLKDADPARRRKYAELLLTTAGNACGFTTCLSASARTLKYRMRATFYGKKKRMGTVLLFMVMAVSVFCTGQISLSTDRNAIGNVLQFEKGGISEAGFSSNESQGRYTQLRDTDELMEYLSELQTERMMGEYSRLSSSAEPMLYGVVNNITEFSIFDEYMEVRFPEKKNTTLYHLTEPVDWQYICSLF